MAQIAAVALRAALLSVSAIIDETPKSHVKQCYPYAAFQSSWNILVFLMYYSIWIGLFALCSRVKNMIIITCKKDNGGAPMYHKFSIQEPTDAMNGSDWNTPSNENVCIVLNTEQRAEDCTESKDEIRDFMMPLEDNESCQTIPQTMAPRNAFIELFKMGLQGTTCYGIVILLQFHDVTISSVWAASSLIIGIWDISDSNLMVMSVFMSIISCTLIIIGANNDALSGDEGPKKEHWIIQLLNILPPILIPCLMVFEMGHTTTRQFLTNAAPVTTVMACIIFTTCIASVDICSVDIVDEWENGMASIGTTGSEWDTNDIFLFILCPVFTFLSTLIIVKGATTHHSAETGVALTLATCVKYMFSGNNRDSQNRILQTAVFVLSLISILLVALKRTMQSHKTKHYSRK